MKITCTQDEYKVFQDIKTTDKIAELKELLLAMGVADIEFDITDIASDGNALDSIKSWLISAVGTSFDGDGQNGPQCKDFVNAFADYLDHPLKPSNAAETWDIEQDGFWKKLPFTKDFVPQTGDIVIWKPWKENQYGHIAVVLDANNSSLTSVDQNWLQTEEQPASAQIVNHPYDKPEIAGYLRPSL